MLLSTGFLLNPKNEKFITGRSSHLPGQGGQFCVSVPFMVIPVLMFIIGLGSFIPMIRSARALEQNGVGTQAVILSKRIEVDSESDDTYYVTYRYYVREKSYEQESTVSEAFYQRVQPEQIIQIVYEMDHPTNADVAGETQNLWSLIGFSVFWLIFTGGFSLFGIALVMGSMIERTRMRELRTRGQQLEGRVVSTSTREDSDDDFLLKVVYQFISPATGEWRQAEAEQVRNDLKKQPSAIPMNGTPVTVLYASEENYRLL